MLELSVQGDGCSYWREVLLYYLEGSSDVCTLVIERGTAGHYSVIITAIEPNNEAGESVGDVDRYSKYYAI